MDGRGPESVLVFFFPLLSFALLEPTKDKVAVAQVWVEEWLECLGGPLQSRGWQSARGEVESSGSPMPEPHPLLQGDCA